MDHTHSVCHRSILSSHRRPWCFHLIFWTSLDMQARAISPTSLSDVTCHLCLCPGKDGTALVSRSVQSHRCLRVLGLAGCKLGPKGTQALCNMVRSNVQPLMCHEKGARAILCTLRGKAHYVLVNLRLQRTENQRSNLYDVVPPSCCRRGTRALHPRTSRSTTWGLRAPATSPRLSPGTAP